MVFQCIKIRQVPWEMLKTAVSGLGFQHLTRDLANVNAWETMFDPYSIRLISALIRLRIYIGLSRPSLTVCAWRKHFRYARSFDIFVYHKIMTLQSFLLSDIQNVFMPCSCVYGNKVNKWTKELIQSDPHQADNSNWKDRQIQLSNHKMKRWQAEFATLSQKGGNSVNQTLLNKSVTYIMVFF